VTLRAVILSGLLLAVMDGSAVAKVGNENLTLAGRIIEGGLVRGATEPGAKVTIAGRRLRVTDDGYFVFGLGRNAPAKVRLVVSPAIGPKIIRVLRVRQRKYRVQRITGLPEAKVTPPKSVMTRIKAESGMIRGARRRYTAATWYRERFVWPVRGAISGVYGSQRFLNGKPRQPHLGVDIAAATGVPVVAAATGVVSLARADMYFTGNTVMIDHGQGVGTIYSHLSKLFVRPGQKVKRGTRIGLVGATGRVTGSHLHWGLSLYGSRLDPALLVGRMPGNKSRPAHK
jgi:murein DD-endopeptidase MepM/ murein hydrolase activator NlpD